MTCCSSHHDDATPPSRLSRRAMLAGGLAAGLAPFLPGLPGLTGTAWADAEARDFAFLPPRPTDEVHVRPIMYPVLPDPVLGSATWTDTYLAPRSGGRLHEGQDLIGKKMLKLLAVVDGTIVSFNYAGTGNSIYLLGDDGWFYNYLHINNDDPGTDNGANQFGFAFAPGMGLGTKVKQGDHIAFLGDSGNAEATVAHLHFEIRMPNAKWYNAAAVNPKYSLDAALPAKQRVKVGPEVFAPSKDVTDFVVQQNGDFLGGVPNLLWAKQSIDDLQFAVVDVDPFIESVLAQPGSAGVVAPTLRLFLATFLRLPDTAGIKYWISKVRAGTALDGIADQFADTNEFKTRYGALSDTKFVTAVYQNLFGRDPDSSGLTYWTGRLAAGRSRGWVIRQLSESNEYQRKMRSQVRVLTVYLAMLQRIPDLSSYNFWVLKDASSTTGLQQLIKQIRGTVTYANRCAA